MNGKKKADDLRKEGSRVGTSDGQTVSIDGKELRFTHLSKVLWPKKGLRKADYLKYVYEVSAYMLPFLRGRALTLLRYPDGADGEAFYQKNCPDYAPEFIQTVRIGDINYIVGDGLPTLMWLANQLAFEIHVPFQTADLTRPSEIVLDLDPPSRAEFALAVRAALMIKAILDRFRLASFVKTSGNKGLQVYIPLPDDVFTYEETRTFTAFLARYLTESEPGLFTTERLKKNRGRRLYIDIVQHAEGKTIIAPYAVRGNADALVATPLYWEEVTPGLRPEQFPLDQIPKRLAANGCPFSSFFEAKASQPFRQIIDTLKHQQQKGASV